MTIHQISVFLENRPGQLAEITSTLSASQIDLRAINIAEVTDYGVLRLIADQPERAASVLLEKGFILSMTPVVAVGVPDAPGGPSRRDGGLCPTPGGCGIYVFRLWPQRRSSLYDLPGGGYGQGRPSPARRGDHSRGPRSHGYALIQQREKEGIPL